MCTYITYAIFNQTRRLARFLFLGTLHPTCASCCAAEKSETTFASWVGKGCRTERPRHDRPSSRDWRRRNIPTQRVLDSATAIISRPGATTRMTFLPGYTQFDVDHCRLRGLLSRHKTSFLAKWEKMHTRKQRRTNVNYIIEISNCYNFEKPLFPATVNSIKPTKCRSFILMLSHEL